YPTPLDDLGPVLDRYPNAELVWVQEEPENQGAWPFIALNVAGVVGRTVSVVARSASASPASGSAKIHSAEQADLIARALA
ncbi:MAG: hypothetical protein QM607_03080, partial [Microbacterium sp.]